MGVSCWLNAACRRWACIYLLCLHKCTSCLLFPLSLSAAKQIVTWYWRIILEFNTPLPLHNNGFWKGSAMALPINLVLLCNKKIGTKTKFLSPYSVCFLGASLEKVNSRVNEVTSTCYVFNEDGDIEAPYAYMYICKMAVAASSTSTSTWEKCTSES